jgi:hypothetical protein
MIFFAVGDRGLLSGARRRAGGAFRAAMGLLWADLEAALLLSMFLSLLSVFLPAFPDAPPLETVPRAGIFNSSR